jgi:plastocyanin
MAANNDQGRLFKTMTSTINTKTAALVLILCILGIVLAGCINFGEGSTKASRKQQDAEAQRNTNVTDSGPLPGANEVQIVIENFAFVPSEVTITPGTKVTWINKDEAPHTATSTDKRFNSGGLDTDDKYSFVFNDKGEYPYFCALQPHMTAMITVK